jgi:hypothetical protein
LDYSHSEKYSHILLACRSMEDSLATETCNTNSRQLFLRHCRCSTSSKRAPRGMTNHGAGGKSGPGDSPSYERHTSARCASVTNGRGRRVRVLDAASGETVLAASYRLQQAVGVDERADLSTGWQTRLLLGLRTSCIVECSIRKRNERGSLRDCDHSAPLPVPPLQARIDG